MSGTKSDIDNETGKAPIVVEKDPEINTAKPVAKPTFAMEPVQETVRRNLQSGLELARRSIKRGMEDARRNIAEGMETARRNLNEGAETARRNLGEGVESARRNIGEGAESARTNIVSGLETARVGINSGLISAQQSLGGTTVTPDETATITRHAEYMDEGPHNDKPPAYESLEVTTARLERQVAERGLVNTDSRPGVEGQESGVVPGNEK